jgi:hypothetical protein
VLFLDEFTEFRRDAIEGLAPDACRFDPSAPCAYWHLKLHALNGGRSKMAQHDLEFVGVNTGPLTTPGWRSPTGLYLDEFDAEVDPIQRALALLGQSRVELLG